MSSKKIEPFATSIEELSIKALSEAFDEFVRACMDDNGKPTAPSFKALAKARGYLPPYCASAYKQPAQTSALGHRRGF